MYEWKDITKQEALEQFKREALFSYMKIIIYFSRRFPVNIIKHTKTDLIYKSGVTQYVFALGQKSEI